MTTLRTITVADLIERLQDEDPNALVIFSSNYGDYSRTQQALPISGDCETVELEQTAYSESGWAVARERDRDDEPADDGDDAQTYPVIR